MKRQNSLCVRARADQVVLAGSGGGGGGGGEQWQHTDGLMQRPSAEASALPSWNRFSRVTVQEACSRAAAAVATAAPTAAVLPHCTKAVHCTAGLSVIGV